MVKSNEVLMIHAIHGGRFPKVTGSASLEELDEAVRTHRNITFDDGLASQELAFPILRKYRRTGVFLVNNDNPMERHRVLRESMGTNFYDWFWRQATKHVAPEGFLGEYPFYSEDERTYRYFRDYVDPIKHDKIMDASSPVVAMLDPAMVVREGHLLGLHSANHPRRMDLMKPHEQYDEWMENLAYVRQYQCEVVHASYPMGRYNRVTIEILRSLGIDMAYTSWKHTTGYMEYPRTDIHDQ